MTHVLCQTCRLAPPARGYDDCVGCFAAFLLANPEEGEEWLRNVIATGAPLDEDDNAIVALLRADNSTEGAALTAGGSLPLAAGAAAEVVH